MTSEAGVSEVGKALRRMAKQLQAVEAGLKGLERARADLDRQAFVAASLVAELHAGLAGFGELPALLGRAETLAREIGNEAATHAEHARRAVPLAMERLLGPQRIPVEGHFPTFRAGLFTVVFKVDGEKPEALVQYGPGIETLRRVAPDAEAAAGAVVALQAELDKQLTPPAVFLPLLYDAYTRARRQAGQPAGWPAPIAGVMLEVAFLSQGSAFFNDPVRERFRSYGRVRFSYDLFRLTLGGQTRADDAELVLVAATREQTRHPSDHLWIPRNLRGDGTHYASLLFREETAA